MFQGEGSNSSSSVQDEPSSSQVLDQQAVSLASLQAILREREREIVTQRMESERFLKELQESVECPVCFSIRWSNHTTSEVSTYDQPPRPFSEPFRPPRPPQQVGTDLVRIRDWGLGIFGIGDEGLWIRD